MVLYQRPWVDTIPVIDESQGFPSVFFLLWISMWLIKLFPSLVTEDNNLTEEERSPELESNSVTSSVHHLGPWKERGENCGVMVWMTVALMGSYIFMLSPKSVGYLGRLGGAAFLEEVNSWGGPLKFQSSHHTQCLSVCLPMDWNVSSQPRVFLLPCILPWWNCIEAAN